MRVLKQIILASRNTQRRHASTQTRNVVKQTLKYSTVVGLSGYLGYALARQIVAPIPVPVTADLPESELRAISRTPSHCMVHANQIPVQEVENTIENHPVVQELRRDPNLRESRPHLKMHEADRPHNLTAGTLAGPGKITVAPYVWGDKEGKSLFVVAHLGHDVCGHDGIVHGGLLSTLLDEGLARCCFPALPNKIGVTANLNINYRKPTRANQFLILKAKTTKVEGRKAWVEGYIESLPTTKGDPPVRLVEATALFIEPKYANLMKRVVRTDHLE